DGHGQDRPLVALPGGSRLDHRELRLTAARGKPSSDPFARLRLDGPDVQPTLLAAVIHVPTVRAEDDAVDHEKSSVMRLGMIETPQPAHRLDVPYLVDHDAVAVAVSDGQLPGIAAEGELRRVPVGRDGPLPPRFRRAAAVGVERHLVPVLVED